MYRRIDSFRTIGNEVVARARVQEVNNVVEMLVLVYLTVVEHVIAVLERCKDSCQNVMLTGVELVKVERMLPVSVPV